MHHRPRRGPLLAWAWLLIAACPRGAPAAPPADDRYAAARERMVRDDLAACGIADPRVLESMRLTPRHEFLPPAQRTLAYFDMALPIGDAQTISGPYVVASMTERLQPRPTDRILEIGTGSGYQAAVLAPLVGMVYTIEIEPALAARAARTLARLGYRNVVTKVGDGFQGWPEHAPFDGIIVTCSPEEVPGPLVEQLAEGGRMVIPVGERFAQELVLVTKRDGRLEREPIAPTLFVPMTGTAEARRRVQPDGGRPALRNGGFEERLPAGDVPVAWYYGRQIQVVEGADAAQGRHYLRLHNDLPGRPAQLFQGFAIDGATVGRLVLTLRLRGRNVTAGRSVDERPGAVFQFLDAERTRVARATVGPWSEAPEWRETTGSVVVPDWAREASLMVGLKGATGTLELDDVRLEPRAR